MRTNIDIPDLTKEKLVTAYAQQRPFREGGNRLQKVVLKNKVIVHNYGHGGAGVSLAPGSAIEAVDLAQSHLNQNPQYRVAVIGSGIIGLFNCYELLKRFPQLKITVYAQRIPQIGEKDNNKLITSQVAPGFWLPYHYGSKNPLLHAKLSKLSLEEYQKLANTAQYKSVLNPVQMIDITDEEFKDDYFKVLTDELKPTFKQYAIKINNVTTVQCRGFTTLRIDMQPFLHIFIGELRAKGVKFVEKKINEEDLNQLREEIIFNCAGLGSKELFGDNEMKGIKGHLLEFRNENPAKFNYFLRANVGRQFVNYYMHDTRIILGLTREAVEDSRVDPHKVALLFASHQALVEKLALSPPSPKL